MAVLVQGGPAGSLLSPLPPEGLLNGFTQCRRVISTLQRSALVSTSFCFLCKQDSEQVSAFGNCFDYSEHISDNMSLTH